VDECKPLVVGECTLHNLRVEGRALTVCSQCTHAHSSPHSLPPTSSSRSLAWPLTCFPAQPYWLLTTTHRCNKALPEGTLPAAVHGAGLPVLLATS